MRAMIREMREYGFLVLALAIAAVPAYAQEASRGAEADRRMIESAAATSRNMSQRVAHERLRSEIERNTRRSVLPAAVLREVEDLYRQPTAKELKTLEPLAEDAAKYADILKKGRSGLVRLVEDAGCGDTTKTVSATGRCLEYSMPGNGSAYSFRILNYRLQRLADLHYAGGNFLSTGIMHHGLITGIGDIPLDSPILSKKIPGPIKEFRPVTNVEKALKIDEKHEAGWRDGQLYFGKEVRAVERMTYILRSVAYNGNYYRAIKGVPYDELEFDKRGDMTIAFRIVRKHGDGSITILWRELSRQEAPKLIAASEEAKNVDGTVNKVNSRAN